MTERRDSSPRIGFGQRTKAGILTAAVLAIAVTGTQTTAQGKPIVRSKLWEDIGASERIDFSGRLHMLSQRIAASTCNMGAGVEPQISRGILAGSADEMDRIMKALQFGNPRMKIIGEETNPRIMANITKIDSQWEPIRKTIDAILTNGYDERDLAQFEEWNEPFFDDANLLVSEIAAQYSNPADLLQADAILVDLAGRQRMRSQMLLKQACVIWNGDNSDESRAALQKSIDLFDRTIDAMLNGVEDVGIRKAPTDKIQASLTSLNNDWTRARVALASVATGQSLEGDVRSELYLQMNSMLIQSNDIVTLYTKFAKHQY